MHDGDVSGGHIISDTNRESAHSSDVSTLSVDVTSAATTPKITGASPPSGNDGADENKNDTILFALNLVAEEYIPLFEVLATSFWRLVWCSAIFVALLSWDMAMDEVGWLQSVWVPLVPLGYGMVLRCLAHLFLHNTSDVKDSTQDWAEKAVASHDGKGGHVSLSPLHVEKL